SQQGALEFGQTCLGVKAIGALDPGRTLKQLSVQALHNKHRRLALTAMQNSEGAEAQFAQPWACRYHGRRIGEKIRALPKFRLYHPPRWRTNIRRCGHRLRGGIDETVHTEALGVDPVK